MKCSKIMAVAMCGVLAFAVAGCRYDDVAGGTEGDEPVAVDVATDGDNANGADVGSCRCRTPFSGYRYPVNRRAFHF